MGVETALGRYSYGLVSEWSHPFDFDADEVSSRMLDAPEVWSDGSMILDSVTGVFCCWCCDACSPV